MGGVPPLLAAEGEWTPPLAAGGTERALGAAARAWGGWKSTTRRRTRGGPNWLATVSTRTKCRLIRACSRRRRGGVGRVGGVYGGVVALPAAELQSWWRLVTLVCA